MIGVAVLGSTGSIGESTLDVVARHPDRFRLVALGAHRNAAKLAQQISRSRPAYAALADADAAAELDCACSATRLPARACWPGPEALEEIATLPEVDCVMAAIVGAAGLRSTLAAARAGKRLLLANKESLVMAGPLLMAAVRAPARRCCPSTASTTPSSSACRRGTRAGRRLRACGAFCSPPPAVRSATRRAEASGRGDSRGRPARIPTG